MRCMNILMIFFAFCSIVPIAAMQKAVESSKLRGNLESKSKPSPLEIEMKDMSQSRKSKDTTQAQGSVLAGTASSSGITQDSSGVSTTSSIGNAAKGDSSSTVGGALPPASSSGTTTEVGGASPPASSTGTTTEVGGASPPASSTKAVGLDKVIAPPTTLYRKNYCHKAVIDSYELDKDSKDKFKSKHECNCGVTIATDVIFLTDNDDTHKICVNPAVILSSAGMAGEPFYLVKSGVR
jgi:hypothetical protein